MRRWALKLKHIVTFARGFPEKPMLIFERRLRQPSEWVVASDSALTTTPSEIWQFPSWDYRLSSALRPSTETAPRHIAETETSYGIDFSASEPGNFDHEPF
jgi:hypothetical protein